MVSVAVAVVLLAVDVARELILLVRDEHSLAARQLAAVEGAGSAS